MNSDLAMSAMELRVDDLSPEERVELESFLRQWDESQIDVQRARYLQFASLRRAFVANVPAVDDTTVIFAWLRDVTNACWAGSPPDWLEGTAVTRSALAPDHRRRWSKPMSDREVHDLEDRIGVRLPPDYVAFLTTLHRLEGTASSVDKFALEPARSIVFGPALLPQFLWGAWVNRNWLPEWGFFPDRSIQECESRLEDLLATAEPLVEFGPLHLVCSETPGHDCVISIHDFDSILWNDSLRHEVLESLLQPDEHDFHIVGSRAFPIGFEATWWGRLIETGTCRPGPTYDESEAPRWRAEADQWLEAYFERPAT